MKTMKVIYKKILLPLVVLLIQLFYITDLLSAQSDIKVLIGTVLTITSLLTLTVC